MISIGRVSTDIPMPGPIELEVTQSCTAQGGVLIISVRAPVDPILGPSQVFLVYATVSDGAGNEIFNEYAEQQSYTWTVRNLPDGPYIVQGSDFEGNYAIRDLVVACGSPDDSAFAATVESITPSAAAEATATGAAYIVVKSLAEPGGFASGPAADARVYIHFGDNDWRILSPLFPADPLRRQYYWGGQPAGDYLAYLRVEDTSGTVRFTLEAVPFTIPDLEVEEPPLQVGDQMTFLPWVKHKLGRAASVSEGSARPTIQLKVTATSSGNEPDYVEKQVELYGPGDVLGIHQSALLGTMPSPNETQFSPLQLPSIEFKDEDLPWRYSTIAPGAEERPTPWCFLLVLEESEYSFSPQGPGPLPLLTVQLSPALTKSALFPSLEAQTLSAHVQLNKNLPPDQVEAFLNGELKLRPGLAFSRVFSLRRLKPTTTYRAFLLPALEAGRLAGLGQVVDPATGITSTTPALLNKPEQTPIAFPVYYDWEFTTSQSADFESLVRDLHPVTLSGSALETVALTVPGFGAGEPSTHTFPMPGVVMATDAVLTAPPAAVSQYLYEQLKPGFTLSRPAGATGRPVLTPPLYGRSYLGPAPLRAPDAAPLRGWPQQLNLDPRYRSVASLGAQLVQEKQEEYVQRAWDQVQDILLVNQKLRGAQYGLRTTAGLRYQHLPVTEPVSVGFTAGEPALTPGEESMSLMSSDATSFSSSLAAAPLEAGLANYGLHLTALALGRVRPSGSALTVRETIRQSATPLAVFSPAFRRITKPFGRFQAGQAGPPRRPTQAPLVASDPAHPTRVLGPDTTLAQRDAWLTLLQQEQLIPAPARPDVVRAYQFDDAAVDTLLAFSATQNMPPRVWVNGTYQDAAPFQAAFTQAFNDFRFVVPETNGPGEVLQFLTEPRRLPTLPLEQIKAGVVAGTQPERTFVARIEQALNGFTPPPVVGDFEPLDFTGTDFRTGVAEEAAPAPVAASPLEQSMVALAYSQDALLASGGDEASTQLMAAGFAALAGLNGEASAPRPDLVTAALPAIPQLMAYPVFKDALGELLRQRHPELFLPGLGDFPASGIALLDVNQAFIEAFLLGANHALGSELLWRDFPTDLRGSYFQQFWDVSEQLHLRTDDTLEPAAQATQRLALETAHLDVLPLDQWESTASLGSHSARVSQTGLQLAIRSELIRRYPNLVICAQPAGADGQPDPSGTILYPQQQLSVGQDIVTLRFALDLATAVGDETGNHGYFLVFMERPGQPQFGLDEEAPDLPDADGSIPKPATWDDLSWEYMATALGANLVIDPVGKPQVTADPIAQVTDSAQLAYALFQAPVRAAIHASVLLAPQAS